MKSQRHRMSSLLGLNKATDSCSVAGKTSTTKSDFDSKEMQDCFQKLIELVPATRSPHGKEVDRTELLWDVIDYIYDLQDTLDVKPATSGFVCDVFKDSSTKSPECEHSSEEVEETAMTTDSSRLPSTSSELARLGSLDGLVHRSPQ